MRSRRQRRAMASPAALGVADLVHKLVALHVPDPSGAVTRFAMQLLGSNIAASVLPDERVKAEAMCRRLRTEGGEWAALQALTLAWAGVPGVRQKACVC